MKKKLPEVQYNESLLLALLKNEDKLRSICYQLKSKGKTRDYQEEKDIAFLDLVYYGIRGAKFSLIADILEV